MSVSATKAHRASAQVNKTTGPDPESLTETPVFHDVIEQISAINKLEHQPGKRKCEVSYRCEGASSQVTLLSPDLVVVLKAIDALDAEFLVESRASDRSM